MTVALIALAVGVWTIALCLFALVGLLAQLLKVRPAVRATVHDLLMAHKLIAVETHQARIALGQFNEQLAKQRTVVMMTAGEATKH